MTDKLQQTIEEELAGLPKEWQTAISSFPWVKTVEEIGVGNELDEEQVDSLILETFLVLTGYVDPEFYIDNIEKHVDTMRNEAEKIAKEAIEKVFTPINNTLTEKMKGNAKNRTTNWQQNIDFILSGGNYSSFMTPVRATPGQTETEKRGESSPLKIPIIRKETPVPKPLSTTPALADIQANITTKIPIKPGINTGSNINPPAKI